MLTDIIGYIPGDHMGENIALCLREALAIWGLRGAASVHNDNARNVGVAITFNDWTRLFWTHAAPCKQ